jgi:hypothetical protein
MLAAEGAEVNAFDERLPSGVTPVIAGAEGCGARAPSLISVRAVRVGAAAAT